MNKFTLSFFAFSIFLQFGCKHKRDYNGELITDNPCDSNTVYFQNTILPLLISNCGMIDCHDAISHKEGINVTSWIAIMNSNHEGQFVDYGNPEGSLLFNIVADGEMPPAPYGPLSPSEVQLIYDWIEQGAFNNYCAECDSNQFAFNNDILPIITLKCSGCHNATTPNGGIQLTNYSNISFQANNGLLAAVMYGITNPIMPPSVGLPDCEKTKIIKWINDGAPNN